MANLKDLIVNGAARVIGKLYASEFVGNLTGNVTGNVTGSSGSCTGNAATATTADKATKDGSGNVITDTYATKTELNTANYAGSSSAGGVATSSYALHSGDTLDTQSKIDDFIGGNGLRYAAFTAYTDIGLGGNDGMILSIPWPNNPAYGAQIAFDDSTTGLVKVRGKSSSWGEWKQLWKSGDAVTGAVWNDLIDCIEVPEGDVLEPGYCYGMCEDGHYRKTDRYLDNKFVGIDSDTYSLAMGMEPEKRKLNAAVSGFVLAYVDKEYPIGTALTCTENGFLTEMKREDKCYNPELIVATYWKSEEKEEIVREDKTVKVNGRKWVKIK